MKKVTLLFVFLIISFFASKQKSTIFYYAATVKALYLNCGNELYISTNNCSNLQSLRYEADNAELITDPSANRITVVPKAAKVSIRVFDGDSLISTEHFPVRLLPKPEIIVSVGTWVLPIKEAIIEKSRLTELNVKALAEQGYVRCYY